MPTRKLRDGIRKSIGNDKVIFFLLGLEREVTLARLTKRHGDSEAGKSMTDFCIKVESFYELKAQDEDDTFDIIITKDMTPKDVAQKIMEIVKKLKGRFLRHNMDKEHVKFTITGSLIVQSVQGVES